MSSGTEEKAEDQGPDLAAGIEAASLADGTMLRGHVGDEAVLLARRGDEYFAVGATCTHYNGPLDEGLLVDDTVRCPWHHACFSLRTGEALRAPALSPLACWTVERRDDRVIVQARVEREPIARVRVDRAPARRIVIVGGGAAGFAAAEMLVRQRFSGSITMLSDDAAAPVDRPNLSKDYLAGTANADWVPLRDDRFYPEHGIDLRLSTPVATIAPQDHEVTLGDGSRVGYDALLLATGAEPVRLSTPGSDLPHVRVLRSRGDCEALIARASTARCAVVMGASFIGLEVAASLRTRGLEVHVVAPDKRPMERVLGPQIGDLVRRLHEKHGVIFHLEDVATAIDAQRVRLRSGALLAADLVVAGIGVRPRLALAERSGLAIDRGVVVDARLATSAPAIYAAGDIARWPDPHSGAAIRVEHWVVALRQGQVAALNMLGAGQPFDAVPFFWSQHYDLPINYVGHAESWDDLAVEGDVDARDAVVRFRRGGRLLAAATICRDRDSLKSELEFERRAG